MEIKIGIAESHRELVINSNNSVEEVESAVSSALSAPDSVLSLVDEKGRKFLIAASKVSYVEIGSAAPGRVGFTAILRENAAK